VLADGTFFFVVQSDEHRLKDEISVFSAISILFGLPLFVKPVYNRYNPRFIED